MRTLTSGSSIVRIRGATGETTNALDLVSLQDLLQSTERKARTQPTLPEGHQAKRRPFDFGLSSQQGSAHRSLDELTEGQILAIRLSLRLFEESVRQVDGGPHASEHIM